MTGQYMLFLIYFHRLILFEPLDVRFDVFRYFGEVGTHFCFRPLFPLGFQFRLGRLLHSVPRSRMPCFSLSSFSCTDSGAVISVDLFS